MKKKYFTLIIFLFIFTKLFSQNTLSDVENKFNTEKYVYSFFLDVLKSQNKNTIHNYSDIYKDFEISDMDGERIITWESRFTMDEINAYYSNSKGQNRIRIGKEHIFIISNFQITNNSIILSGSEYLDFNKQSDKYCPIDWSPVRDLDEFTFIFVFDGDYLNIYYNEENPKHLFYTFCKVTDETYYQIENLIKTNKCDLSKVTWPKHADGTCDYDDSKSTNTVVSTNKNTTAAVTNVSVNKQMSVTENLKLRSGEATTTSVLTVMQVGTKVKILQLGKAETIDGINSNWVKVEVQKGAKDRDGKEIKEGTVGWCYGGYLKDTTTTDSVKKKKKK